MNQNNLILDNLDYSNPRDSLTNRIKFIERCNSELGDFQENGSYATRRFFRQLAPPALVAATAVLLPEATELMPDLISNIMPSNFQLKIPQELENSIAAKTMLLSSTLASTAFGFINANIKAYQDLGGDDRFRELAGQKPELHEEMFNKPDSLIKLSRVEKIQKKLTEFTESIFR